jgi:hypothetical protein
MKKEIIEIQEPVRVEQEEGFILLEKGDKIEVLKEYAGDPNQFEKDLSDLIDIMKDLDKSYILSGINRLNLSDKDKKNYSKYAFELNELFLYL